MAKIVWDEVGKRFYETGVSKAVLYKQDKDGKYPNGVAWNGITSVTESPQGAEANNLYADNIKYAVLRSAETLNGTIEAYTYPDEWAECDGSAEPATGLRIGQQNRASFGLSYVTEIGNDTSTSDDDGQLIHLIYGATASPSDRQYQTINDSPEAITFSWEYETTPVNVSDEYKPTSFITVNTLKADKTAVENLKKLIWGTDDEEAQLPLPEEVLALFKDGGAEVETQSSTTDVING